MLRLLIGTAALHDPPDVVAVPVPSVSSPAAPQQKRKRSQVGPGEDAMDVDDPETDARGGGGGHKKKTLASGDEIGERFRRFKHFDTVQDFSDHHFAKPEPSRWSSSLNKITDLLTKLNLFSNNAAGGGQEKPCQPEPSKDWVKRIQHEWRVLRKGLPESILVRVYDDRMDLLRAVIVGPAGTPYHDGLFFFDIHFPPNYPNVPPLVHYHSGGLSLNPNLYASGTVCLSLLGTWVGSGCEKWNPKTSTMLQILVSIQGLVLNAKPYFNEPGLSYFAGTFFGEKFSSDYNEDAFLLSCRTMLYTLQRPPMHFEDFVAGHFRERGRSVLAACRAYMGGAQVASLVEELEGLGVGKQQSKSCSSHYLGSSLEKILVPLEKELAVHGAGCNRFIDR